MRLTPIRRIAFAVAIILPFMASLACEEEQVRVEQTQDFELRALSGETVAIRDYRGKVVLLEFWASWCPPCRRSIPELNALMQRLEGEDFALLSIAVEDKESTLRRLVEDKGVKYPVLFDNKGVADAFKVYNVPSTIVLDRDGKIAISHKGYIPGMFEKLEKDIRGLL